MRISRTAAALTSAALLFGACASVDPEEALTESLSGAVAADNDGISTDDVACVTDALMTELGVDGFAEVQVTAEGLAADPSVLRTSGASDRLDGALIGCVDVEQRFAAATRAAGLTSLDPDCVPSASLEHQALALALINEGQMIGPETPADVATAFVDAIRGCVDDTDFASVAGLDAPAELKEVLIADPFTADDRLEAQNPCVVGAVVDALGIERLADLGVTIEDPDFLAITTEMRDDEFGLIVEAMAPCGVAENLTRYVEETETQVGACATAALDDGALERLANDRFRGRSVTSQSVVRDAVDDCAAEALDATFGPVPELSADFQLFLIVLVRETREASDSNRYEEQCLERGFSTMLDPAMLDQVIAVDNSLATGQPLTPSEADTLIEFSATAADVGAACIEPAKRVRQDLIDANLSDDVADCTLSVAGTDVAQLVTDGLPGYLRGELTGTLDLFDGLDLIGEAIAQCGSAADVARWDAYVDGIFDAGESYEPGPIEA